MIHAVNIEVILTGSYAMLLVGVAAVLEFVARHVHRRSGNYRNSGFVYRTKMDVWQCPSGHHLTREQTDFERKIAHYRAPAHKCNCCPIKKDCTDSNDGRRLEVRLDAWLESELSRFHRGISLALLLLATLFLGAEMFRCQGPLDWVVLVGLLIPTAFAGSRCLLVFTESNSKSLPTADSDSSPDEYDGKVKPVDGAQTPC